ncbi:MAG: type II toxin-antitoxin system Phd/YefM family antitoxin [Paracoccaceae bacterium]
MDMTVSKAKAHLADLVRRAEAGEEVILTRNGRPVARIGPVGRKKTPEEFDALIRSIQEEARLRMTPGPDAARSQDFLYDENGLPA